MKISTPLISTLLLISLFIQVSADESNAQSLQSALEADKLNNVLTLEKQILSRNSRALKKGSKKGGKSSKKKGKGKGKSSKAPSTKGKGKSKKGKGKGKKSSKSPSSKGKGKSGTGNRTSNFNNVQSDSNPLALGLVSFISI